MKFRLSKGPRTRFLQLCIIGYLLCSLIYAATREYPLTSHAYLEKSESVEPYVRSTNRSGTKKRYNIKIVDGNNRYYRFASSLEDLGLIMPDDVTDKDYFFDTKMLIDNNSCWDNEEGGKNCYLATFYDGYFYSHKYDKVFRITRDDLGPTKFSAKYYAFFIIFLVFFVIFCVFGPSPPDKKSKKKDKQ